MNQQGQNYSGYQQPYPQQQYQQPYPQQQYPQQPYPQPQQPQQPIIDDDDGDKSKKKILWMSIVIAILGLALILVVGAYLVKNYKDINTINGLQETAYKAGYDRAARDMIVTIAAQVEGVGFVQINYPVNGSLTGKMYLRPFGPGEQIPTVDTPATP